MSQCVKIVFLQNFGFIKNEVFEKKNCMFCFCLFYVGERETEKRKNKTKKREKPKKTIKIGFFKGGHPKMWKIKKGFFLQKLTDTICVRKGAKNAHFRCNYLFWPNFFFGPKQCKAGNTIKIGVSAEIAKNSKNDTFFLKKVFLTWLEKWVLLTVFLESCVFLKTLFL